MFLGLRRWLALLLLAISILMMVWSLWPYSDDARELSFQPIDLKLNFGFESPDPSRAILEPRRLSISWPRKIRLGDVQSIAIVFAPEISGAAGAELNGADDQLLDVFETHNVIVESRLELPGLAFTPDGQVSQYLRMGEPVAFVWKVKVEQADVYEGTAWVYLKFISKETGHEDKQVLTAQRFDFQGVDFFGLNYLSTRLIGSLGIAIGMVLGFDWLWVELWRLIQNRKKNR